MMLTIPGPNFRSETVELVYPAATFLHRRPSGLRDVTLYTL